MRFSVSGEVFALLPDACFGVVVARGAVQGEPGSELARAARERLGEAMDEVRAGFGGQDVKAHPAIRP